MALSGVFFASSLLIGFAKPASAITVIPPRLELEGDPGTTVSGEFSVMNESASSQTYYTQVENFEAKDETGSPQFVQSKEGLAIWVQVASSVTAAGGEKKTIPFSVKIPANAEPGGYFASIFVRTTPPPASGGEVSIGARLGTLILMRVNGDIQEGVDILEFASKEKKRFFTSLPVELYYRFQNTGADRVKPSGEIIIKNIIGMKAKVLSANRSEGSVLPRSIRRFEMAWITSGGGTEDINANISSPVPTGFFPAAKYQLSHFAIGLYTANLNITFGQNNNTATDSFMFFVFPWQLVVIVLVGLLIAYIVLKFALNRYTKRIISKHQRS